MTKKTEGKINLSENLKKLSSENIIYFKKEIAKAAINLEKIKLVSNILKGNNKINAAKLFMDNTDLFGKGIKSKSSGQVYASKMWDNIKDKTEGATSRLILFEQPKNIGKCIHCGKEGKLLVYFGKAY